MSYHSNAFRGFARIRPADGVPALGVLADPGNPLSIIGQAFAHGYVGGPPADAPADAPAGAGIGPAGGEPLGDHEPPEVAWRLVIDRAWHPATPVGGTPVGAGRGHAERLAEPVVEDGRWALRLGEFLRLAEDVE